MLMVAGIRPVPVAWDYSRTAVQSPSARLWMSGGRRVAEDGGELVAAHAGQRVIGPEALGKDVRDGLDQLLRGSRTVPLDHIVVPVHVDGQQR